MLVHRRVTPSSKFAGTHLYTWVERGTMRVKYLAQEHNAVPRPVLEPGPPDPESSTLTITCRPLRLQYTVTQYAYYPLCPLAEVSSSHCCYALCSCLFCHVELRQIIDFSAFFLRVIISYVLPQTLRTVVF